jgi:hypothetical protein
VGLTGTSTGRSGAPVGLFVLRHGPSERRSRGYTPPVGASVTLGAAVVQVEPGGEAAIEVRLRNTGTVVDEFSIDVLGDAAAWTVAEPPTISLFPGADGTVRVVFRPPRSAAITAGSLPFGIRTQSREDPEGTTVEEGVVEVLNFYEPFAELVPRTSRGSRGAGHDVAIDNRGNTRLNAELEAIDEDRLLRFDIDPPGIVIDPGMAGFARLKVKPTKRFWRGSPKTRPFQLHVRPEGTMPITLDGAMLQEPVLPPWFVRAMIALVLLLVALVLLWLLVLKPTIQTAASEAVDKPIAELKDGVNDALSNAGLPTIAPAGAGGPSASPEASTAAGGSTPPATPAPTPGGPVIAGLGAPIDGRLSKTTPTATFTGTLFITDVVFSNPNAREGALVLLRDTGELFSIRLENIRDLDYHFVTPIVLTEGQSLNLSLACTGANATPCDPTVFYSGYTRP